MRLNTVVERPKIYTAEGARAVNITPYQELRRSVLSCMLWEDSFYESGTSIADRITGLVRQVSGKQVAELAIEARNKMHLRHVPLLLIAEMAKYDAHKEYVYDTIQEVIQRPDELAELLAIYSRDRQGTKKLNCLSKQIQKGLATAFRNFDEYSLAKYNRDNAIKLRDVLFLTHAKPVNKTQARLWKRLNEGELQTPDTWEVALSESQGENKLGVWLRLLEQKKLGGLALLRNLRNMRQAGVPVNELNFALAQMKTNRILPFRFIAAANAVPEMEPALEEVMLRSLEGREKLSGKTTIVVDNSGSMDAQISSKSDLTRRDAACALAILVREICEEAEIIVFSTYARLIPPRRGFALRDAIIGATEHGSTNTDQALAIAQSRGYDRVIVITDEQSHQTVRNPSYNGMGKTGYMINVAAEQHGIGYGSWLHIDGWSEAVMDFIQEAEQER